MKPVNTELAVCLATTMLQEADDHRRVKILENAVTKTLDDASAGKISSVDADAICSQSLQLMVILAAENPNPGWVDRDQEFLRYLAQLYDEIPDRLVCAREEKTDCVSYTISLPYLSETKRIIFTWAVRCWKLDNEFARVLVEDAFTFICGVFNPTSETSSDNIAVIRGVDNRANTARRLMPEDEQVMLQLLTEHVRTASLEAIAPWLARPDLPRQIEDVLRQAVLANPNNRELLATLLGDWLLKTHQAS